MTTETPPASQHLAAVLELLDELEAVTRRADTDLQTKAVTAATQAILVLAEQVAAIRVLMVEDAMSRRADGQATPQDKRNGKKRGWR